MTDNLQPPSQDSKNAPLTGGPEKKNPVRQALNAAKWLAHALILPFFIARKTGDDGKKNWTFGISSWKQLGVYFASWYLLLPLSVTLFPRGETALQKAGLDPAIAQKLAPGRDIHVLHDNLAGKAAMLSAMSVPVWIPYVYFRGDFSKPDVDAFTVARPSKVFRSVCAVYLKTGTEAAETEGFDSLIARAFKGRYTPVPLVDRETLRRFTLLHEMRHCAPEQQQLPPGLAREADSDYHAVEALVRETGNAGLRKSLLLYHSLADGDRIHGTALYLDAKFRGLPPPAPEEIERANEEAAPLMDLYLNVSVSRMFDDVATGTSPSWRAACQRHEEKSTGKTCDLDDQLNRLSPLARRRFDLYREAQDASFIRTAPQPLPVPAKPAATISAKLAAGILQKPAV